MEQYLIQLSETTSNNEFTIDSATDIVTKLSMFYTEHKKEIIVAIVIILLLMLIITAIKKSVKLVVTLLILSSVFGGTVGTLGSKFNLKLEQDKLSVKLYGQEIVIDKSDIPNVKIDKDNKSLIIKDKTGKVNEYTVPSTILDGIEDYINS